MGSVSSEEASDLQSERFGSYSLSADVSESESCSSRYDVEGVSGSTASSPLPERLGSLNSSFPVKMPVILPVIGGKDVVFWERKMDKRDTELSEIDMMKERFSKLLLGEDMSGGGKGVCSALAISNAITNLSASVFGELWRLEPLAPQKKALWCREMEWLLCVSDSIVELTPSIQEFPGGEGRHFEVMVSRPRPDLYVNLPALKKLDAMLLSMLDGFQETEFWYVDRGILLADGEDAISCPSSSSSGRPSLRNEEKWWLPSPRVPTKGLSDEARKRLLKCRDCTNQILKAAIAINSNVLAEMEIPAPYMDTLPKNGKSCLGDIIYRYITSEHFTPECLLDCLDLTSEHQTLEIANRIEAAIHVWKQKDRKRHLIHTKSRKPSWGGKVKSLVNDLEKSHNLAQRAESLLHGLRARYPILPQTLLDMNKIQYNRDVGQAILESYSRVMESVAFNIMARIDDIVYVDDTVKQCANVEKTVPTFNRGGLGSLPLRKKISPSPFSIQHSPYSSPFATPTLSSSPANGSPMRKLERMIQGESERFWSFTRSLSATIDTDDALQRD